jgi:hypothetical protein
MDIITEDSYTRDIYCENVEYFLCLSSNARTFFRNDEYKLYMLCIYAYAKRRLPLKEY